MADQCYICGREDPEGASLPACDTCSGLICDYHDIAWNGDTLCPKCCATACDDLIAEIDEMIASYVDEPPSLASWSDVENEFVDVWAALQGLSTIAACTRANLQRVRTQEGLI